MLIFDEYIVTHECGICECGSHSCVYQTTSGAREFHSRVHCTRNAVNVYTYY